MCVYVKSPLNVCMNVCVCQVTSECVCMNVCVCQVTSECVCMNVCVCQVTSEYVCMNVCVCQVTSLLLRLFPFSRTPPWKPWAKTPTPSTKALFLYVYFLPGGLGPGARQLRL